MSQFLFWIVVSCDILSGRFRKRIAMVINPRCPTLTLACPCQYDAGGRSISHAESIPIHLFTIKSSRVRRPRWAYLWLWAEWVLAHHVRQLARCSPCITIKCWPPGAEFKRFCVVTPPLWLLISRPLTIGLERPYCLFLRTVHLIIVRVFLPCIIRPTSAPGSHLVCAYSFNSFVLSCL
jgi:hypothetical protein